MQFFACLRMVIEWQLWSGWFWSMLSAPVTGCVFGPSWVSPQVVLRGAPDPPAFKTFFMKVLRSLQHMLGWYLGPRGYEMQLFYESQV